MYFQTFLSLPLNQIFVFFFSFFFFFFFFCFFRFFFFFLFTSKVYLSFPSLHREQTTEEVLPEHRGREENLHLRVLLPAHLTRSEEIPGLCSSFLFFFFFFSFFVSTKQQ